MKSRKRRELEEPIEVEEVKGEGLQVHKRGILAMDCDMTMDLQCQNGRGEEFKDERMPRDDIEW